MTNHKSNPVNFYFDGNKYSSIFSKNAIKRPDLAGNWVASWRDVHDNVHHDILYQAATNNQAEYGSLLMVIRHIRVIADEQLKDPWLNEVIIHGDSQLVIYQVTGKYRVKEPDLHALWLEVVNHVHVLKEDYGIVVKFRWIKRELNNKALGIESKLKEPCLELEEKCSEG